jgi:hypothetical protein
MGFPGKLPADLLEDSQESLRLADSLVSELRERAPGRDAVPALRLTPAHEDEGIDSVAALEELSEELAALHDAARDERHAIEQTLLDEPPPEDGVVGSVVRRLAFAAAMLEDFEERLRTARAAVDAALAA